jgi:hypothetical protein
MGQRVYFRITGLPLARFAPLFSVDEAELARNGARWCVADSKPGYPCRVSLVDAEPGERVLLLPYTHHDVASPYRSSGPIYVRENARDFTSEVDHVPEVVRGRLISYRAYDEAGFMVAAEVAEGRDLEATVDRLLADERVAYLHLHNAKPGCYSCRVDRASR